MAPVSTTGSVVWNVEASNPLDVVPNWLRSNPVVVVSVVVVVWKSVILAPVSTVVKPLSSRASTCGIYCDWTPSIFVLVLYSPNVAPSVVWLDNCVSIPPKLVVEVVAVVIWKSPKLAPVSTVAKPLSSRASTCGIYCDWTPSIFVLVLYSPNVAPSVAWPDNCVSIPPKLLVEVVVVVVAWKLDESDFPKIGGKNLTGRVLVGATFVLVWIALL